MWTKWLLVLELTISACARISGLQHDFGYSYRQPEDVSLTTIPASLAYYINIPAGQSHVDYYYLVSRPENQYTSYAVAPAQDVSSAYRQPQYSQYQDLGYNRQQQSDTPRVNIYRSYTPSDQQQQQIFSTQALPSVKTASDFAPKGGGFQVDSRTRSHQQSESSFTPPLGRNIPRPDYQDHDHSAPSQELTPPPYKARDTSQFEPKGVVGSAAKQQYHGTPATVSLPTSYNAQLPFAIGAVPIKFKPFPLKTHLRQSGLLPITSYQARESYKK